MLSGEKTNKTNWLDKIPYSLFRVLSLILGLAPFIVTQSLGVKMKILLAG